MDSWLGDFILAFGPWFVLLGSGLWFYNGARVYRKTGVVSSRLGSYLIGGGGYAMFGISQLSGLHSKRLRLGFIIISLVCMLVSMLLWSQGKSDLAPKRPT